MFKFAENLKKSAKSEKDSIPDKEDYRYREHNPHEHPFSGLQAEGWDVVDPEQYYNLPDFKEDFKNYEVKDEAELDLETEELLAKYDFEELDLKMYSESARNFLRGQGKPPFRDINKNRELAAWCEAQLEIGNKYGLPFTETELARITDTEKKNLVNLYKERSSVQQQVNQLLAVKSEPEQKASNVVYSTDKTSSVVKEKNHQSNLNLKQLVSQLYNLNSVIGGLETQLLTDPEKERKIAELKRQKEERRRERQHKHNKRREQGELDKKLASSLPEYSLEEIELQDECLNYLTIRKNKKDRKPRPAFVDGVPLSGEQILEVAQEGAEEKIKTGEMMKATFFEEVYNGRRQLAYVEKNGNKRIKYILISPILPACEYAFKIDIDSMFITKNNPNSAMASINLMVNLDDPKKVMAAIMENKNKNISSQKKQEKKSA